MRLRQRAPAGSVARPGDAARRAKIERLELELLPTSQGLSIVTDDAHAAAYVKLAYGDLLRRDADRRERSRRAVLRRANGPTTSYDVDQCVWRAVAGDPTWRAVYGAAVAFGGSAALIVGPSGAGKTTLCLSLVGAGATVYGDEIALVHRADRTLTAVSRRIAVREASFARLDDADVVSAVRTAGHPVREAAGTIFLVARETFGPVPPPLPLRAIVVVRGYGDPALATLPGARAALTLAPYLGTRPESLEALARIVDAFASVPAFALTAGEPAATAATVLDALERC